MPQISCGVLARPTKSLGLYLQMAGRILRPSPGKTDAIILDHAGNFAQHGAVDRERKWRLTTGRAITDGQGATPERVCPECSAVCPREATQCAECGYQFPQVPRPRSDEESPGLMVEANEDSWQSRRELFFELVEVARTSHTRDGRPYRPGYAIAKFHELTGQWPPWGWQREAGLR
jgi:hypothetical protein